MITTHCAVCGDSMVLSDNAVAKITPIGLVHNICCDNCLKIFNNCDAVLGKTISTKGIGEKKMKVVSEDEEYFETLDNSDYLLMLLREAPDENGGEHVSVADQVTSSINFWIESDPDKTTAVY